MKDADGADGATDQLEDVYGITNKGSSSWTSPEGQKFTLEWTADEAGFQPKGDPATTCPLLPFT